MFLNDIVAPMTTTEAKAVASGWALDPKTRLELKKRKEQNKIIAKYAGKTKDEIEKTVKEDSWHGEGNAWSSDQNEISSANNPMGFTSESKVEPTNFTEWAVAQGDLYKNFARDSQVYARAKRAYLEAKRTQAEGVGPESVPDDTESPIHGENATAEFVQGPGVDDSQSPIHEARLTVGDPIVVTGPNEFEGKTGEISEFSPSGKFVIVNLYNHGKQSMHLSDVEYNEYADQEDDLDEGWSDAIVAQRTGRPRTPYSVYIKGRKWKDFENDDHAEAVANKLRAKFKREGRNPDVITIAPTDHDQGVAETQTDYSKRRQRERDIDAGKPVSRQPKNPQTDYQKRRAEQKRQEELGEDGEGTPEGLPHLTKELLTHIVDQVGSEGAHAIIKSLEWGDGAAEELLALILKDLRSDLSDEEIAEHIGKVKGGFRLYSGKGKNLGTFPSRSGAEKHEREVQYFKHAKEGVEEAKATKQRLDKSCRSGYHKNGTQVKNGVRVNKCVKNESVKEATDPQCAKAGKIINRCFGKIYDYGDDGLEYLDHNAPVWSDLFNDDQYDGDIDVIIANAPIDLLVKSAQEMINVVSDLPYELDEANDPSGQIAVYDQGMAIPVTSQYAGDGQFKLTIKNKPYIVTVAGWEINHNSPGILDSFYLTDVKTGKTEHVTGGWNYPEAVAIFNNLTQNQKPALVKIYKEDMAFHDKHGWDERLPRLEGLPLSGYNAIPADRFIKAHQDMKKVTGQNDVEESTAKLRAKGLATRRDRFKSLRKESIKESYWTKLQNERNTKLNSLVNELKESVKKIK